MGIDAKLLYVTDAFVSRAAGWRGHGRHIEARLTVSGEVDETLIAGLQGAVIVLRVNDAGNLIGAIQGGDLRADPPAPQRSLADADVRLAAASAVIGFVLSGRDAVDVHDRLERVRVAGWLTPEHFPEGRCRVVWSAVLAARARSGFSPFLGAVIDELERENTFASQDAARWIRLSTPDRPRAATYDEMPAQVALLLTGDRP